MAKNSGTTRTAARTANSAIIDSDIARINNASLITDSPSRMSDNELAQTIWRVRAGIDELDRMRVEGEYQQRHKEQVMQTLIARRNQVEQERENRSNLQSRINNAFTALSKDEDTVIDFNGGRVVLSQRETRNYAQTGEPWIIRGANTLHADYSSGEHVSTTYVENKEDALPGIFTSRQEALNALKERVDRRINQLNRR